MAELLREYGPGESPSLTLTPRFIGAALSPIAGVVTGDPDVYAFDLSSVPDGDYSAAVDDPTDAFLLRYVADDIEVLDDWEDAELPQPGIPPRYEFGGTPTEPPEDSGTIVIDELVDSRPIREGHNRAEEDRRYSIALPSVLMGHEQAEMIVRSKVLDTAPASVQNGELVIHEIEIEPLGGGEYTAEVRYALPELEREWEWDTTGGREKIRQSFATQRYGTGPDFKGLIGCNDGQVEGVEIPVGAMAYRETHAFLNVPYAYRNMCKDLVGYTNAYPWRGFPAQSVIYLGTRARKSGREMAKLIFEFAAGENVVNLTMPDGITIASKTAWQYLWTYYEQAEDTSTKRVVPQPKAHYVETVHRVIDFAIFGIGTT